MSLQEASEQLAAIVERCETKEDIQREVEALSPEDKMRIVYQCALDEFEEAIRAEGIRFVDWLDDNGVINDYQRGCSRREPVMGMLSALSIMLKESSEIQARQEMQACSEGSEFGMRVAEKVNELAVELHDLVADLSTLEAHYHAILKGRQMDCHFTDQEGTHVPYSAEEIERIRLQRQELREWLAEQQEKMKKDPADRQGQEVKQ